MARHFIVCWCVSVCLSLCVCDVCVISIWKASQTLLIPSWGSTWRRPSTSAWETLKPGLVVYGLLKDESAQTPVESFKVLTLHCHRDNVVCICKLTSSVQTCRLGCNLAAIQDEWQGLKTLVSHNFKDKSYSGLWETMLKKDPYRLDYKVGQQYWVVVYGILKGWFW